MKKDGIVLTSVVNGYPCYIRVNRWSRANYGICKVPARVQWVQYRTSWQIPIRIYNWPIIHELRSNNQMGIEVVLQTHSITIPSESGNLLNSSPTLSALPRVLFSEAEKQKKKIPMLIRFQVLSILSTNTWLFVQQCHRIQTSNKWAVRVKHGYLTITQRIGASWDLNSPRRWFKSFNYRICNIKFNFYGQPSC